MKNSIPRTSPRANNPNSKEPLDAGLDDPNSLASRYSTVVTRNADFMVRLFDFSGWDEDAIEELMTGKPQALNACVAKLKIVETIQRCLKDTPAVLQVLRRLNPSDAELEKAEKSMNKLMLIEKQARDMLKRAKGEDEDRQK